MLTYTTTLLFACQAFFPRLQKFTAFFAPLFSIVSSPAYRCRKIPPYTRRASSRLTLRQNFVFFPCIRTHGILRPPIHLDLWLFGSSFRPANSPALYANIRIPAVSSRLTLRQNFVFFPCIRTHDILSPSHTLGLTALRIAFSPRKFTCPVRQYPYTRIMSAAALGFFPCVSPYSVRPRLFSLSQKKPPVFQRTADLFLSLPFYPLLSSNILAIALTTMSISVFEVFAHIS